MTKGEAGSSSYSGEEEPSNIFLEYREDADIHPNELSGDEQGEKSIFATSVHDIKASTCPLRQTSS